MNRLLPAAFVIAWVLTLGSPSVAQPYSLVPPDNSAADQYAEAFPGAGGNNRPNKPGDAGPDPAKGNSGLPPDVREGLVGLGPSGEATAQVIERTVISARDAEPDTGGRDQGAGSSIGTSDRLPVSDGESGLKAGFLGITEMGLGLLLPLLLLATAAAAIVLVARRKQSS